MAHPHYFYSDFAQSWAEERPSGYVCRVPDMAQRLAQAFERQLFVDLGPYDYAEAVARNTHESPDGGVCHTHDFIDANESMADAFRTLIGREHDGENDADNALWTAAWTQWKHDSILALAAREQGIAIL